MIHPTAIIHPQAKLDSTVQVGPYAVVDEGVELGANCIVGPHVYLTGLTTIGAHNHFHAGCVIGDAPQDLKYDGVPTRLRIGEHNVFREHVTAHRSTRPDAVTIIGSHNFLMANAHVAHNCIVGDHVILANGALLGGYAVVQDRAFISGNCVVHQFTRIGTLTMMQGNAGLSQDLPPFTMATGINTICGLNVVGLRRAGFSPEVRMELKQLYHLLFRSGKNLRAAVTEAQKEFTSAPAKALLDFIAEAKRGVCADAGRATGGGEDE
ncbi:MAG: acyl-ACP--UDP-N-acetylglucosamine O-acyltransferase [Verrucomicrobiota bacterium]|jgi:UDP-N-acetylglucosamine acyltransferase